MQKIQRKPAWSFECGHQSSEKQPTPFRMVSINVRCLRTPDQSYFSMVIYNAVLFFCDTRLLPQWAQLKLEVQSHNLPEHKNLLLEEEETRLWRFDLIFLLQPGALCKPEGAHWQPGNLQCAWVHNWVTMMMPVVTVIEMIWTRKSGDGATIDRRMRTRRRRRRKRPDCRSLPGSFIIVIRLADGLLAP